MRSPTGMRSRSPMGSRPRSARQRSRRPSGPAPDWSTRTRRPRTPRSRWSGRTTARALVDRSGHGSVPPAAHRRLRPLGRAPSPASYAPFSRESAMLPRLEPRLRASPLVTRRRGGVPCGSPRAGRPLGEDDRAHDQVPADDLDRGQPLAEQDGCHHDRVRRLDRADERGLCGADPPCSSIERLDRDERRDQADPDEARPRAAGIAAGAIGWAVTMARLVRMPQVEVIIRALATAAPAPSSPSSPERRAAHHRAGRTGRSSPSR